MKNIILIALTFATTTLAMAGIAIKPVANNPACYGTSNGSIQLYVSGGVLPLSYAWSNSLPSTPSQANLAAGSYTVTITDGASNQVTKTITLVNPAQIIVNASVTDATSGNANGAVNLDVQGGTPGYTFNWNNNSTNENLWDVLSGSYAVTVTDASGCSTTVSSTVNQQVMVNNPTAENASPSNVATGINDIAKNTPSVYPNPSTGNFTVKLNDNTNAQISLMNMNGQLVYAERAENNVTQVQASNLPAGAYVMVVNNNGVSSSQVVNIAK